jgi:hypothetical protein
MCLVKLLHLFPSQDRLNQEDLCTAPGNQPAKPPSYDDWLGEDPKKQAQSGPPPAANYSGPPPNVSFNIKIYILLHTCTCN